MPLLTLLDGEATTQDFIDLYGMEEAIEITNLCEPLNDTVDMVKLQAMIDNAKALVLGRLMIANECGRALIKVSAKQLILWISRYIGDSTKSRPFVSEDYDRAIAYLDYACKDCSKRCPLTFDEIKLILGDDANQTRSRFRAYCGVGNKFKTNIQPMPKVDYGPMFDPYSLEK